MRGGQRSAGWLVLFGLVAGCAAPTTTSPATVGPATVGPAPLALVQQAIDRFNRTAGGPLAAQQKVLKVLVASGQAAAQKACPVATTTIALDPVYARLAPAPQWHPSSGLMAGTPYELPTLIRIYTGDRITGTDLTDLHVTIDAGQVLFPAVCLR